MSNIVKYSEKTFEDIKHVNENGQEFWYARELQGVLEYTEWRNFSNAIDKAKIACKSINNLKEAGLGTECGEPSLTVAHHLLYEHTSLLYAKNRSLPTFAPRTLSLNITLTAERNPTEKYSYAIDQSKNSTSARPFPQE